MVARVTPCFPRTLLVAGAFKCASFCGLEYKDRPAGRCTMCAEDSGAGSAGWLCRGCLAGHTRGMLPGHQATPPETRSDREVLLAELGVEAPPTACVHHSRRGGGVGHLAFFCPDDGAMLCALCVLDHRAHGYIELPVVAAACRVHIASLVDAHGTWPQELASLALPPPEHPSTGAPPTPEGAARLQREQALAAGRTAEAAVEDGIEASIAELQVRSLGTSPPSSGRARRLHPRPRAPLLQAEVAGVRSASAAAEAEARAAYDALIAAAAARYEEVRGGIAAATRAKLTALEAEVRRRWRSAWRGGAGSSHSPRCGRSRRPSRTSPGPARTRASRGAQCRRAA